MIRARFIHEDRTCEWLCAFADLPKVVNINNAEEYVLRHATGNHSDVFIFTETFYAHHTIPYEEAREIVLRSHLKTLEGMEATP